MNDWDKVVDYKTDGRLTPSQKNRINSIKDMLLEFDAVVPGAAKEYEIRKFDIEISEFGTVGVHTATTKIGHDNYGVFWKTRNIFIGRRGGMTGHRDDNGEAKTYKGWWNVMCHAYDW